MNQTPELTKTDRTTKAKSEPSANGHSAAKSPNRLKAKDPKTAEPSKPKLVISGPTGVGKTWWAISFPNVYYIDTEKGADRAHYTDKLKAGGGVYMGPDDGTLDPDTIIEQFVGLATEKHQFKTVVVDSITKLFHTIIAKEQERLGEKDAFGASKKPAIAFMRRLLTWTDKLDMNIIFVAHETAEWGLNPKTGERAQIGLTADVWEKLPYELDLWLQLQKQGSSRIATVKKSRLQGFPESDRFPLDYESFSERYGADVIEKPSVPIQLATADQVAEINRLIDTVKVDQSFLEKCLTKAGAETYAELNTDQAAKLIDALKKKIS
jgi:hypothetical protein